MLLHNASNIGVFHAAAPASLAARSEDPLPTLEPADVLLESLAQELAAASTFSASHPVDLTRESRGKRDRYRPRRRHTAILTQCLTGLGRSDLAVRREPKAAQQRAVLLHANVLATPFHQARVSSHRCRGPRISLTAHPALLARPLQQFQHQHHDECRDDQSNPCERPKDPTGRKAEEQGNEASDEDTHPDLRADPRELALHSRSFSDSGPEVQLPPPSEGTEGIARDLGAFHDRGRTRTATG